MSLSGDLNLNLDDRRDCDAFVHASAMRLFELLRDDELLRKSRNPRVLVWRLARLELTFMKSIWDIASRRAQAKTAREQ